MYFWVDPSTTAQGPWEEENALVRDLFWAPLYIITDWELHKLFSTMTKKLDASLFYIIIIHHCN